ncbi:ribonuclease P protein component [Candidatus Vecturithrix granuli]|uniref:Ribonuclease P protein component n=1 Tax=Vecturithrix granuli TaxID=1499967 RepID=A0A081C2U1_VECG1|nr:ribonuclease P protein component [Candidatus Vecturithrix granuli]
MSGRVRPGIYQEFARMSASFAQYERIKRRNDFKRVYEHGEKRVSSSFLLYLDVNSMRPYRRLGITVRKKIGNAVIRNRCKRIVREVFRRNKDIFPQGADVVVVIRQDMVGKRYGDVLEEMCNMFS